MLKHYAAGVILFVSFSAGTLSAQSGKVDFARDVLPVLRENCVGCHGPTQQMNNFRLDRRSVAFRGGTRSVLIPGSSESSRLYLRIAGQRQFGNPMPPAGPLSPDTVALLKRWIDEGAVWPDEFANEEDLPAADPKAVRMITALQAGDLANFQKLIAEDPKAVNLRGPEGTTPFMAAVLYADAATVKQLLERGADPNKNNDAGATPLMWAATNQEKARLMLERGANPHVRSKDGKTALAIAATQVGTTPVVRLLINHGVKPDEANLRDAVVSGDAELVRFLVDSGVPVGGSLAAAFDSGCTSCVELISKKLDARGYTAALQTLSVAAKPHEIKYVLDRGANPNTSDGEGRTPLMNVANSDRLPLESVRMLIDKGADVNARNSAGQTVLDMAKLHGDGPIVDVLVKAGAKTAAPPAPTFTPLKSNSIEAAVKRSLPIIQKADVVFMQKSGCISCHNEALPQLTVAAARKTGFKVDETMAAQQVKAVVDFFTIWRDRLIQGVAPGGVSYALVALNAMGYKPDSVTDAIARDIRMHQLAPGNWRPPCGGSRSPHCGFEITGTALAMRALQFYAPKNEKADYDQVIERAASWLTKAVPQTTEDRTFRLFGLVWSRKDKTMIQQAMKDLLTTQRPDGGWSDVPTLNSGAYATGQALVALHEAGMPPSDPAYQRGVKFLLSTQLEDGSWYQKTRSLPVQPYFDVGFPHGFDQWISISATSWATMALAYGSDRKPSER